MINIRTNVFETNSSSTHSITMTTEDLYQKWVKGDVYYVGNSFLTFDEMIEVLSKTGIDDDCIDFIKGLKENNKEELERFLKNKKVYTFDSYQESVVKGYYEWYKSSYTTPNGERVVAFGYYGDYYGEDY